MSSTRGDLRAPARRRPGFVAWVGIALLFVATGALALAAAAVRDRSDEAVAIAAPAGRPSRTGPAGPADARLEDTGLYADFAARRVAADVLAFTPQYPLWTDGATKRRWIRIPAGESIDATDPDAWKFPAGTQLWKEFSFGRRVETRTMELGADGRWLYATYAWSADESDAVLAPEYGVRGACSTEVGSRHDIPSVADCGACHDGGATPVLGFGALQLSSDRDPLAPHAEVADAGAVFLDDLVERGLVRNLPAKLVEKAPRIAATSPRERAALGYLHGNCGSCHNARGSLATLGLELDYTLARSERRTAPALRTALGATSRFQIAPDTDRARIEAGASDRSTLVARISSRFPAFAMPPLGTRAVDADAVALIRGWIDEDVAPQDFATRSAYIDRSTHSRNHEKHR